MIMGEAKGKDQQIAELWKDNHQMASTVKTLRIGLAECMREIELLRSINGILADQMAEFAGEGNEKAKAILGMAKRLIEKADEDEAAIMGKADGQKVISEGAGSSSGDNHDTGTADAGEGTAAPVGMGQWRL